jgi:hypothetical protein
MSDAPQLSVVIPVYRGRDRIGSTLRSLAVQRGAASFEVIVVDSGDDGCADYVDQTFPGVTTVRAAQRLRPAAARNLGISVAEAEAVAFLPDDAVPCRRWVSERVRLHREGFDCVGGAVVAARTWNPIALAEHFLEYSALLPTSGILDEQSVPHSLSFSAALLDVVGPYDEDTTTGEDTLLNLRALATGASVVTSAQIWIAHSGSKSVRQYVSHAFQHGRGLVQCVVQHDLPSDLPIHGGALSAAYHCLLRYPGAGIRVKAERLVRHAPVLLPVFVLLLPLVLCGLIATGAGALHEIRHG